MPSINEVLTHQCIIHSDSKLVRFLLGGQVSVIA